MNGIEFFLTRYVQISGMIRNMFADLSEAQIRLAPCEGVNTLAWLGWHIPRVEDVGLSRFVLDDEQLFVRDGWDRRLGVAQRDFGTGMTPTQVSPRGSFLCHLALTHKCVHAGKTLAIRGLMGHPGH